MVESAISKPSLDIERFLNLEFNAIDFLSLIRGVPQLPPLLESKSVMLPDAFVRHRISSVGSILDGLDPGLDLFEFDSRRLTLY